MTTEHITEIGFLLSLSSIQLLLLRYIESKDEFLYYYTSKLERRLIHGDSFCDTLEEHFFRRLKVTIF